MVTWYFKVLLVPCQHINVFLRVVSFVVSKLLQKCFASPSQALIIVVASLYYGHLLIAEKSGLFCYVH